MAARRAGISIGARAFSASFLILLGLMMGAGILTRAIPAGSYDRVEGPAGTTIAPESFRFVPRPDFPVWRWFTAPVEVLGSEDALQVGVIIAFIAIVGGSFAVLQKAGILESAVSSLAAWAGPRKRLLLALVSLFFMLLGSLMGIFEEVIPLVPVAVALSLSLGWDVWIGLGMSVLATGFGFSAAIANPFSIGTAQRLAGLPMFSGALFRVFVFAVVYAFYLSWLLRRAKRVESLGTAAGATPSSGVSSLAADSAAAEGLDPRRVRRGVVFFALAALLLLAVVMSLSLTRVLADYSMPITALIFLGAGLGAGFTAGLGGRRVGKAFFEGILGILPGAVLVLQAVSVKRIIIEGGVMDTILHGARLFLAGSSGYGAAALVYLFTLGMNFFIGSATAKAFLLMPLLAPLADLAGLSRQTAVQAFAFGDGFSNMLYPTNAVLLISLGLAGVSWPAWFKRTAFLQLGAFILTMALLMLAVAIGYT